MLKFVGPFGPDVGDEFLPVTVLKANDSTVRIGIKERVVQIAESFRLLQERDFDEEGLISDDG